MTRSFQAPTPKCTSLSEKLNETALFLKGRLIGTHALRDLETAYTNFFRVFEDRIQLPHLGTLGLKERSYIPTSGVKVLSATVCERAGKWFVSVLVEEDVPEPIQASGQPIGVDLGISSLAVCSDGRPPIRNPKVLHTNLKQLKRAQRHLSRCKKGSKNRQEARQQVARLHARIAHIREDALHQATSSITHAPLTPSERISLKTRLASLLPIPKTKAEQKKTKKQVKKLIHCCTEANAPLRPQVIVLEDLHVDGLRNAYQYINFATKS